MFIPEAGRLISIDSRVSMYCSAFYGMLASRGHKRGCLNQCIGNQGSYPRIRHVGNVVSQEIVQNITFMVTCLDREETRERTNNSMGCTNNCFYCVIIRFIYGNNICHVCDV